jgi:hypothetical protein
MRDIGLIAVVGVSATGAALILLDDAGILAAPPWIPVALLPVVGALIWRLGRASMVATASWVVPLTILMWVGFEVVPWPFGFVLVAGGWLGFVAMIARPQGRIPGLIPDQLPRVTRTSSISTSTRLFAPPSTASKWMRIVWPAQASRLT